MIYTFASIIKEDSWPKFQDNLLKIINKSKLFYDSTGNFACGFLKVIKDEGS